MKKRSSVFARLFALIALVAAIAAVYLVASNALDEDSTKSGKQDSQQTQDPKPKPQIKAATYEVKSGDTLTRISYRSGVKVTELLALNPEIDPQNLVIGQIIKLR
ncbi:MAG: LysM domain [Solirubrobacterales bacterium]|jgi:LysM repeat protein|nr:LysM domain [Solirubrobacterales bacterium]